jgi:hypothetical protein
MKKIIISISLVAVLLLAACSTDHDNGNDEARKNSSHHEISKNKSGENQKTAKTDTSVKVQIPKMEFPFKKDKDIPIEFTVTKDGKPYRNAVLALQVDLGPVGVPFNAKEVGKGHYKSSVHVIKPGTYQARVIEKKGEDIKSLSSFQLRFKQ